MRGEEAWVEVPGSQRQILRGARQTGPTNPGASSEVTLLLRRRARHGAPPSLEDWGHRPLRSRTYLTRQEFVAEYGAREEDFIAVRSFATTHGLRVVEENPAGRRVRLAGTIGDLAAAFGVELHRYEFPGGGYRGRTGAVRVPVALSGRVVGLVGLGGGFQPTDLSQYFQELGIPAPTVTAVSVDGAGNSPTGSPDGPDA